MAEEKKKDEGTVDLKMVEGVLKMGLGALPVMSDKGKKHLRKALMHLLKFANYEIDSADSAFDVDG